MVSQYAIGRAAGGRGYDERVRGREDFVIAILKTAKGDDIEKIEGNLIFGRDKRLYCKSKTVKPLFY